MGRFHEHNRVRRGLLKSASELKVSLQYPASPECDVAIGNLLSGAPCDAGQVFMMSDLLRPEAMSGAVAMLDGNDDRGRSLLVQILELEIRRWLFLELSEGERRIGAAQFGLMWLTASAIGDDASVGWLSRIGADAVNEGRYYHSVKRYGRFEFLLSVCGWVT